MPLSLAAIRWSADIHPNFAANSAPPKDSISSACIFNLYPIFFALLSMYSLSSILNTPSSQNTSQNSASPIFFIFGNISSTNISIYPLWFSLYSCKIACAPKKVCTKSIGWVLSNSLATSSCLISVFNSNPYPLFASIVVTPNSNILSKLFLAFWYNSSFDNSLVDFTVLNIPPPFFKISI